MGSEAGNLTQLLNRLSSGDQSVEEAILDRLYGELRRLAGGHLKGKAQDTLQPTALVHEAWMRLVQASELDFGSRTHFFKLASQSMRSILVDHHRRRKAEKRGGNALRVTLVEACDEDSTEALDVLALDEALERLAREDEELARVVELRFFGGLTLVEIQEALGIPLRTLERRWKLARAWLHAELTR